MSPLAIACLWCFFQVTLLSAMGIAISLLAARRYPVLAVTSTTATVAMVFVVTLLIPVRIPLESLTSNQLAETQAQIVVNQTFATKKIGEQQDSKEWSIDFHSLASRVFVVFKQQKQHISLSHRAIGWIQLILAAIVCVGIVRFVRAVCAVERIRRNSRPVDNERANQMLFGLAQAMSRTAPVQLRVSDEVDSPAVLGWLRPLIVLPRHWQTWESHQLQTVLAHELAHVVRHDFFWRGLATFMQGFHFYHPLSHWLLVRLTYSQELAADQLASETLGCRKTYSKALSQLAIRQDDHLLRLRAEPILLPTLTSHLIRRIKMLRTMECVEHGRLQRVNRMLASCLIVLLGVGTVALRGLAQSVEGPAERDTARSTSSIFADESLFRSLPTDPSMVGDNERGLFAMKVSEILKNPSVQSYLPLLNAAASEGWKNFFDTETAPALHLEMIDFVVGPAELTIKRLGKGSPQKDKNRMMIGGSHGVVRFHQDISNWKEWIRKNVPIAKEMHSGGTTYFQFPVIPAIGPTPACVAARDSRTLVVFHGYENKELPDWTRKNYQQQDTRWDQDWETFDTGMISLLSSSEGIDPSLFLSEKPAGQALDQIFDKVEQIGYSVDWNDVSGQMGIKIRLCCQDQQAADDVKQAVVHLTAMKLEEAKGRLAELDNPEETESAQPTNKTSWATREDCLRAIDFLENYQANNIVNPDDTVAIEVVATMGFSLVDFVQDFIQSPGKVARIPKNEATK